MLPDISREATVSIANESAHSSRAAGAFEQLPKWLNLVPMVIQWLWLAIRYRSVTLPSTANPAILAGG